MVTIGESYVERTEKALVETAVLEELRRDPNLTMGEIVERVRALNAFDEKVDEDFIRHCVKRLDRDGHVEEENDRFTITEDGLQDIRKIENALCCVAAAEIPGVTVPESMRGAGPGSAGGPGFPT